MLLPGRRTVYRDGDIAEIDAVPTPVEDAADPHFSECSDLSADERVGRMGRQRERAKRCRAHGESGKGPIRHAAALTGAAGKIALIEPGKAQLAVAPGACRCISANAFSYHSLPG